MKWTWEDLVQKFRCIMVCPNNIYGHTYGAWLALIHNINIFKLYLDQILFASTHAYGIFRHWADPNSGPAEAQHCPREYSNALGFSFGFSFIYVLSTEHMQHGMHFETRMLSADCWVARFSAMRCMRWEASLFRGELFGTWGNPKRNPQIPDIPSILCPQNIAQNDAKWQKTNRNTLEQVWPLFWNMVRVSSIFILCWFLLLLLASFYPHGLNTQLP